jgi:aspartate kinase
LAASLENVAEVRVTPDLALVSLVGQNVARDPAISARAMSALPGLPVRMIFHGASDMNLSFVVPAPDADIVVRALHQALFAPTSLAEDASPLMSVSMETREAVAVGEV